MYDVYISFLSVPPTYNVFYSVVFVSPVHVRLAQGLGY